MKLIEDWLKGGQAYAIGVRLYLQYGNDAMLRRLFAAEGETPFKKKKLVDAMQQLLQPAAAKPAPPPQQTTNDGFAKAWPVDSIKNDAERQLHAEARLLLKRIAAIHAQLEQLPNDVARRQAAFELLRLDEQLDGVYARRDYLRQYGRLPEKEKAAFEEVTDPLLIGVRMETLKRNIRRQKDALRANPDNQEAQQRLARYVEEYNVYARKLGRQLKEA